MLNNFLHDFTAALWLALTLVLIYLNLKVKSWPKAEVKKFYLSVFPVLFKTAIVSLTVNLVLGVVRAMAYYQYEYLPAAGKGQVIALIFKHILIVIVVIFGFICSWRLLVNYRRIKGSAQNG